MSKNTILIIAWFIGSIFELQAQDKDKQIDSIAAHIERQLQLFPQEKIYLQSDRPSYISGETVWFRIYVLDASTHHPSVLSRYAYVELINEQSDVVCRIKVKPDDSQLHCGYLKLPEDLPEGNYRLRTYTRYLSNFGEDYFYSRNIRIFNPKGNKSEKKQEKETSDYEVSLFPEGGYLLEGTLCQVAFKALNQSGLHEDIEGELVDEAGAVLQTVSSYHDGMGSFVLQPVSGKKYYLNCVNKEGKRKRYELPEAKPDTYSLNVKDIRNEYLEISILKSEGIKNSKPFYLLIHTDGLIQYLSSVENIDQPLVFNKKDFPSGISQILLLDTDLNPLSERLVFVQNNDQAKILVKSNKREYSKREKVKIETAVTDKDNQPLEGNFSVSVIDGNDVKPDTTSTILTAILLTSELKGNIENPGFYFQANNPQSRPALDLLMQTQGWRRYDIPKAIKGNYTIATIKPEQTQTVSGKTIHEGILKNSDLKNGKIMLFVPAIGFVEETGTDAEGRFSFENFELPDSLRYVVQALTDKDKDNVRLVLDEETFPSVAAYSFPQKSKTVFVSDTNYIAKADRRYTLENGMRIVQLKEVTITAERKKEERSIYARVPTYSFDREHVENHVNMEQLLRSAPGVTVAKGKIYIRGDESFTPPALIIIDDMIMGETLGDAYLENINEIERVDIVSVAGATILGSRGAGGAVVITTKFHAKKWQDESPDNTKLNVKTLIPLGYQKPAEFYAPQYQTIKERTSATPDLRTTIYWNPDVWITEGKADFDFYAADLPSTYYVVIEGIASNGKLIHQVSQVEVTHGINQFLGGR